MSNVSTMPLDRRSDLSRHLLKYDLRDMQEMIDGIGTAMFEVDGREYLERAAKVGHDESEVLADRLTKELGHEGWLLALGLAAMDLATSFVLGYEHIVDTAELYAGDEE